MLRVGLTGGIGAGKSEVTRRLAHHGAVIIDADVLAREVVASGTDGLAEVVSIFGPAVLNGRGELDRPALAAKVFGDESARRQLEQIIHPRVRARTADLTRRAAADAIVVNDVPLLVETGLAPTYHLVLVVDARPEVRLQRLVETRGMTPEQAQARIAAQADDARRRDAADVLVANNGDLNDLHDRVDQLYRYRLRSFEEHLRRRTTAQPGSALRVVEPDPTWPAQAARLMARIRYALRATVHAELAHIGSTAVAGLPARDIIDLMLAVHTVDDAAAIAGILAEAGFPRRPGEWADNPRCMPGETWPKWLHGSADPGRPVNLHIRVAGSPGWRFALLMRDHLRAVPQARTQYAAAKAQWALQYADRSEYAEARQPWFDAQARAADDWAHATGWQPTADP